VSTTDPVSQATIGPLDVTASAVAGPPTTMVAGGTSPTAGPSDVGVVIGDPYGSLVSGVEVTFTPGAGSGTATPSVTVTNPAGVARTTWRVGPLVGVQTLVATVGGVPPLTFQRTVSGAEIFEGTYGGTATQTGGSATNCSGAIALIVHDGIVTLSGPTPLPSAIANDGTFTTSEGRAADSRTVSGRFVMPADGNPTASGTIYGAQGVTLPVTCTGTWTAQRQ
jgi:hypothetical protein